MENSIVDVLSDVLSMSKMGNAVICESKLLAPWGLRFEAEDKSMFQLVKRGACYLQTDSATEPVRLMQGDLVLLTRCRGHVLTHEQGANAQPFREVLERHMLLQDQFPENANVSDLLCGVYYFENFRHNPILAQLPEIIHLTADEVQRNVKLQSLIQLLTLESKNGEVGSNTVITRLVDIMFIYIVRAWLDRQSAQAPGWLLALKDPRIGKAIGLMHGQPANKWTVGSLAEQTGMSRSSFAQKFTTLVGETPLSYLTNWRIDLASKLLLESGEKLAVVAAAVGYDSETAFSKTFKKYKTVSPGSYRAKHA